MKAAFPYNPKPFVGDGTQWAQDVDSECTGMTLREHYAGLAMQGIVTALMAQENSDPAIVAQVAFKIADAMLKEATR